MAFPSSWGPSFLFLMFWANFRWWGIFSSSDKVRDVSISWNYILLSVTDNFGLGKWAKIERNDSKLLPGRLKSVIRENSELINQDARIVRASPISFFEVARYDCLPHRFSHKHKNWKESDFQLVFEPVFFLTFSLMAIYYYFIIVLWLKIHGIFMRFFSVIWFGNLCCNYL